MTQTVEEWKHQLVQENFGELWVHTDPPGHFYEEHSHPVDTAHVVLDGSMTVSFDGKENIVKAGQRLDVLKNVPHTARIGEQGCTFLIGVRL